MLSSRSHPVFSGIQLTYAERRLNPRHEVVFEFELTGDDTDRFKSICNPAGLQSTAYKPSKAVVILKQFRPDEHSPRCITYGGARETVQSSQTSMLPRSFEQFEVLKSFLKQAIRSKEIFPHEKIDLKVMLFQPLVQQFQAWRKTHPPIKKKEILVAA